MSTEHPHSAYIARLGGPTKVAGLCRIRPQAVSQWRRFGIPPARLDYLMLLRPDVFEAEGAPSVPTDEQEVRDAA